MPPYRLITEHKLSMSHNDELHYRFVNIDFRLQTDMFIVRSLFHAVAF